MLADHMYERFGRPDFVIAEHDTNDVAAGSIAIKGGPLLASATTLTVTIRGIGGHGSAPQSGKDPIVLAAEFVLVAQTIVSRQIDPQQPAVLTVGTIHGGTKNNIIPDEVTMGLTLRTYSPAVRDQIVADRAPHRAGAGGDVWRSRGPYADSNLGREHARDLLRPCAGRAAARVGDPCSGQGPRARGPRRDGKRGCGAVFAGRADSGGDVLAGRGRSGQAGGEPQIGRAAAHTSLGPICAGV